MQASKYNQQGNVLIIVMVLFIVISLSIASGLVTPVLRAYRIAQNDVRSTRSYALAESGAEDAYYRILKGKQISSTETLTLDGHTATTTISTIGGSQKTIVSQGDVQDAQRKISVVLTTGTGIAFNYGLQAGNGGMTIGGTSTISGNVYSNSSINASSASITGSAVAADSAALTADQSNETPIPPTNAITFRNSSSTQDFAQSFQISSTAPLNKVQFYIKKVGSPADATIRLVADNNGTPSTTTIPIGTVALSSGQVTTSYGWVEAVFQSPPSLMTDTTYWIVVDNGSQHQNNYYMIAANTSYASGTAKTGSYGSTWTAANLDGYFRIYTGGIVSLVGGGTSVGGVTIGSDAWATKVTGATVQGNLFCQTGQNTNKACNTARSSPSPQALPFSDSNLAEWKDEGAAGGTINGDYSVGGAGDTLGPKKITGNLTVGSGGTLTLTGTLWVEGNVTVTSGGKIVLPTGYAINSGKIISDGRVSVSGGGSAGSGTPGSYLFIVSTSQCPNDPSCGGVNAITISGNAGAIAVDAQYGTVGLTGGAAIKAVVGNAISVSGGSVITYENGLASPSFSVGPSGAWEIQSWKETQ
jgi:fibronectin-binding autotransporter adhesin